MLGQAQGNSIKNGACKTGNSFKSKIIDDCKNRLWSFASRKGVVYEDWACLWGPHLNLLAPASFFLKISYFFPQNIFFFKWLATRTLYFIIKISKVFFKNCWCQILRIRYRYISWKIATKKINITARDEKGEIVNSKKNLHAGPKISGSLISLERALGYPLLFIICLYMEQWYKNQFICVIIKNFFM